MKLCENCKHCEPNRFPWKERCRKTLDSDGDSKHFCQIARMEYSHCGPGGKNWEKKE